MRIGIDISQIVYEGTGVGKYVKEIVRALVSHDVLNKYILFGASLRMKKSFVNFYESLPNKNNVTLKVYSIPPTVLCFLWNTLHVIPVEWLIGRVDIFWSSDWTQPPLLHAKGITTIHDLTIMRFPESFHKKIVDVQTMRMKWAKKECNLFLCDSIATKQDCTELLKIEEHKLKVIYPGFT